MKTESFETTPRTPEPPAVCVPPLAAGSALTRYQRDVLKSAQQNHMWINAFSCVRPTDELKMQIGAWVLSQLADPEACIQADFDDCPSLKDLRMPELILRFNKS